MMSNLIQPLVINLRVVKMREGSKLFLEVEIVMVDGTVISRTVDASKSIQLSCMDELETDA